MANDAKNDNEQNRGTSPDAGQNDEQNGASQDGGQSYETLEQWLEEHDKDGIVSSLVEGKVAKLMNALQRERENNKTLSTQLRTAAKSAPSDELKHQLEAIADERDAAVRRADFYSVAAAAGCTNIDAAYHIAVAEGAFDASGRPNIEAVKAKVPELFGTRPTPGTTGAGRGATGTPSASKSMNDLIREAAGIRS
jgi:hypothetical protein